MKREGVMGPKGCSPTCESRVFLEEYEKVDREYERHLVRQLAAAARVHLNELEAMVTKLRDPEEERDDGKTVRKDRWESGIRQIVMALGWSNRGEFEVSDVVECVKKLVRDSGGKRPPQATDKGEKHGT